LVELEFQGQLICLDFGHSSGAGRHQLHCITGDA
jgi:hypothetical protein